jgi:hypothetical protein
VRSRGRNLEAKAFEAAGQARITAPYRQGVKHILTGSIRAKGEYEVASSPVESLPDMVRRVNVESLLLDQLKPPTDGVH